MLTHDAVIVLGHRFDKDNGTIIRSRVERAVQAYKSGCAKKVVLSGGSSWCGVCEADFMAVMARQLGVPDRDIILEFGSKDTLGNAAFSRAVMKDYGLSSAIVVTSPFHMPRAKALFSALLPDVKLTFLPSRNDKGIIKRSYHFVHQRISALRDLRMLKAEGLN